MIFFIIFVTVYCSRCFSPTKIIRLLLRQFAHPNLLFSKLRRNKQTASNSHGKFDGYTWRPLTSNGVNSDSDDDWVTTSKTEIDDNRSERKRTSPLHSHSHIKYSSKKVHDNQLVHQGEEIVLFDSDSDDDVLYNRKTVHR